MPTPITPERAAFLRQRCESTDAPTMLFERSDVVAMLAAAEERDTIKALLRRVYAEAGNESPGHRRHALTPGLRDEIRDTLTKGHR